MSTQLCSAPRALHASPSIQIGWGGSIPIFLFSVINLREETTWCSSCKLNTQWWWVSIAYFEPIISSLFSSQLYRYFALGELCSILIFTLFRLFHAVSHNLLVQQSISSFYLEAAELMINKLFQKVFSGQQCQEITICIIFFIMFITSSK